jgi:hypothetical protein
VPPVVAGPPPIVPSTGAKKWKTVETSHYIWARDGGSAVPMPVQWGELGATHNAPGTNLENADPTSMKLLAPLPPSDAPLGSAPVDNGPGCWDSFVTGCEGLYQDVRMLRPQPK